MLAVYGPTLWVDIGFDSNYKLGQIPVPGIKSVEALVDTGAGESCIDSLLAAQLNLPIVDRRLVSGVHGSQQVNMHLAQIHIPTPQFTLYGTFAGVHLIKGGQVHKALIGRTFLRNFTMVYEGKTPRVTISSPSVAALPSPTSAAVPPGSA